MFQKAPLMTEEFYKYENPWREVFCTYKVFQKSHDFRYTRSEQVHLR